MHVDKVQLQLQIKISHKETHKRVDKLRNTYTLMSDFHGWQFLQILFREQN